MKRDIDKFQGVYMDLDIMVLVGTKVEDKDIHDWGILWIILIDLQTLLRVKCYSYDIKVRPLGRKVDVLVGVKLIKYNGIKV